MVSAAVVVVLWEVDEGEGSARLLSSGYEKRKGEGAEQKMKKKIRRFKFLFFFRFIYVFFGQLVAFFFGREQNRSQATVA